MVKIKRKFGVRLFQLRTEAGLTQSKLAEKAHLSVDSISRMERGDRAPSLETLESLALALKVAPAELLNFEGKKIQALAEGSPENLELWEILKGQRGTLVKKVVEIVKVLVG